MSKARDKARAELHGAVKTNFIQAKGKKAPQKPRVKAGKPTVTIPGASTRAGRIMQQWKQLDELKAAKIDLILSGRSTVTSVTSNDMKHGIKARVVVPKIVKVGNEEHVVAAFKTVTLARPASIWCNPASKPKTGKLIKVSPEKPVASPAKAMQSYISSFPVSAPVKKKKVKPS